MITIFNNIVHLPYLRILITYVIILKSYFIIICIMQRMMLLLIGVASLIGVGSLASFNVNSGGITVISNEIHSLTKNIVIEQTTYNKAQEVLKVIVRITWDSNVVNKHDDAQVIVIVTDGTNTLGIGYKTINNIIPNSNGVVPVDVDDITQDEYDNIKDDIKDHIDVIILPT